MEEYEMIKTTLVGGYKKEEVQEFLESGNIEELADILEVVYALSKAQNCSEEELNNIRRLKIENRGAFDKKIFLEK